MQRQGLRLRKASRIHLDAKSRFEKLNITRTLWPRAQLSPQGSSDLEEIYIESVQPIES